MDSFKYTFEWVTPKKAETYLASRLPENYQPVDQAKVARFAAAMIADDWQFDPIKPSSTIGVHNGILADGVHRMHAVIKAGRRQRFWIANHTWTDELRAVDSAADAGQRQYHLPLIYDVRYLLHIGRHFVHVHLSAGWTERQAVSLGPL